MNLPAVGLPEPDTIGEGSGASRPTRPPMLAWDRLKFLLLFVVLFVFFVWGELSDNPLIDLHDAVATTFESKQWLLWLAGLELLRQGHFLLSEHSPGYHQFWTEKVFARFEKRTSKLNPWNRYRLARVVKLLVFLAIVSIVLGALFDVPPVTALFELPARIFDVLPFAFQMMFGAFYVVMQFVLLFWFLSRGGTDVYFPDDIKTRFTDVWGQDPVVDRVKENLVFLERPEVIEEKGGYVPSGILLWGPPGTGKTLLAEAVAGETGKPYVFVDPGAFTNMFIGVGILKVKSLFRKLRKLALRYGGVIVFFDEADVLGNRGGGVSQQFRPADPASPFHATCNGLNYASEATRQQLFADAIGPGDDHDRSRRIIMGGMGGGGGMGTLQALLTELSGLKKPRGFVNRVVRRTLGMKPKPPPKYRILVIMATNLPDVLDPALLRPGRIDRIYHVGYPSTGGRERTYRGYLAKVSHELTDEQIRKLAVISTRGTGASIKDIVNEALVIAIGDGRDTITYNDMIRAKHLKAHGPADDWTYSDWEQHAVAVHEACHAVAMYRLKKREAIDVATIERRGGTGGFVAPAPLEDQFVSWRSELDNEVMTFLASLAGERLLFEGDNSQGVGGDLASSTSIVMRMMAMHGMGDTVASVGATLGLVRGGITSVVEDGTDRQFLETDLGRRVDARLAELLQKVSELLERDRQHVLALAHALETHKTISGDDIIAIFDGTVGPLVDGRPYHDSEYRDELELYHASVVAAMRSQGRVELSLPVLNGHLGPVEFVPAVEPARPSAGGDEPPTNGGVAYPAPPPVLPGEGSADPPR